MIFIFPVRGRFSYSLDIQDGVCYIKKRYKVFYKDLFRAYCVHIHSYEKETKIMEVKIWDE